MLKLRVSSKKQAKIKLALQGCAGSGKTYSALLLAYGLTNDWTKIAIIDSENGSADLYAHLGNYNVLPLQDNFTPETYIEAVKVCEDAKMEVIIIDSISQCWDNLLEYHANLQGNSFTNWQKITPRMNAFMQKILQSPSHVICTMRCKQDYVLNEKNGKMIPEKVGLKAVMRDGIDYEFTIVLDINMKHQAIASKDRTSLFMGKPDFTITPTTGQIILDWCNNGVNLDMKYDGVVMFHRARCWNIIGNKQMSMKDYETIIDKGCSNKTILAMSYNNRAYEFVKLQKYSEALPLVNKAIELDNTVSFIWDTRGELYYHLGEYEKCIQDMDKAISITEGETAYSNSYYYRGLAKLKLQKKSEARKDLKKAVKYGNIDAQKYIE